MRRRFHTDGMVTLVGDLTYAVLCGEVKPAPGPVLVSSYTALHAAHHPGHHKGAASDLTTWTVRNQERPTAAALAQLGVPPDAAYSSGRIIDGEQVWYYERSTPAPTGSTCERCTR